MQETQARSVRKERRLDSQVDTNDREGGSQWHLVAIDDGLELKLYPARVVSALSKEYTPNMSRLQRQKQVEAVEIS